MGTSTLHSEQVNSCRLDWLSLSLFAASSSTQREQLAYCFYIAEICSEGGEWEEGSGRRFFQHSLHHPAGLQVRWTEPEGEGLNKGLISIDIRGTALGAMSQAERAAVCLDFAEMDGFKQCSRIDSQVTVVNPHASAEYILEQVRKRRVWIKGFHGYGEPADKDLWGRPMTGATITWGSPKGATRCRTYNKQAEAGWDVPAVRHEVQLRKQPARDRFNSLVDLLRVESEESTGSAEQTFVQSVLNQHMAYLDTSRLSERSAEQGMPANWAANSKQADWWKEVVNVKTQEMKTKWRVTKALEAAVEARDKQYGRITAKWICQRIWVDGAALADVRNEEMTRALIRLRDEDIDQVLELVDEDERDAAAKWMRNMRQRAAKRAEKLPYVAE